MRALPTVPCLALIHTFEGSAGKFEPQRTPDPTGNQEIGWSHKLSGPDDPLWDSTLTQADADTLALQDLTQAASGVCDAIGSAVDSLTDNQYAAIIDFAYNLGVGAFRGSTLCHYIKTGNLTLAAGEFGKWVHGRVNGAEVVLNGLVRRRAAEAYAWRQ